MRKRLFFQRITGVRLVLVLLLCFCLLGCQVEVYKGLTEEQANTMLSTLLRRGIKAEKIAEGKSGYTLAVDETQLVQSLEILMMTFINSSNM